MIEVQVINVRKKCISLGVFVAIAAALLSVGADPVLAGSTPEGSVRVSSTEYTSIEIDRPAEEVWRFVLQQYDEGKSFERYDEFRRLTGGAATLFGGYYVKLLNEDGNAVDERNVYITERNHEHMRLSLFGEFLAQPFSTRADADLILAPTFSVTPAGRGAILHVQVLSRQNMALPTGPEGQDAFAKQVRDDRQMQKDFLDGVLRKHKTALEG